MEKDLIKTPKILGLDVSTTTIGCALFDLESKELLELTHVSPVIKPKDKTIKELFLKSEIFKDKILQYKDLNITTVVIEEPLLTSNNIYTVQTLLRFNTLISKHVYDILGVVPEYISTYESRKNAFPELMAPNKNGKEVLFGAFPKDCDKKMIIWDLVSRMEPQIVWNYTKNNTLKKESFDMSDAYCCALAWLKLNKIWR
jgi:RNase H-fold protein (predicted Holliday junction resolvase)